jgi:hypothetical protein
LPGLRLRAQSAVSRPSLDYDLTDDLSMTTVVTSATRVTRLVIPRLFMLARIVLLFTHELRRSLAYGRRRALGDAVIANLSAVI